MTLLKTYYGTKPLDLIAANKDRLAASRPQPTGEYASISSWYEHSIGLGLSTSEQSEPNWYKRHLQEPASPITLSWP